MIMDQLPTRLLTGWEMFQHPVNCLVEAIGVLPWRCGDAVCRNAAPDKMPGVAVIHVENQRSDPVMYGARGGGVARISRPSPPVVAEPRVVERLVKASILYRSDGCDLQVAVGRNQLQPLGL